mmetsp:Transcript_26539/g.42505  ORF Transcript_26539/g.42505 Transcript_26539/m.42505 type:complete len:658 (-) Transcript_26539:191-2164(-)
MFAARGRQPSRPLDLLSVDVPAEGASTRGPSVPPFAPSDPVVGQEVSQTWNSFVEKREPSLDPMQPQDTPDISSAVALCKIMQAAGHVASWEAEKSGEKLNVFPEQRRKSVDEASTTSTTSATREKGPKSEKKKSESQVKASRAASVPAKRKGKNAVSDELPSAVRENMEQLPLELREKMGELPPELREKMGKAMMEFQKLMDTTLAPVLKGGKLANPEPGDFKGELPTDFMQRLIEFDQHLAQSGSGAQSASCPFSGAPSSSSSPFGFQPAPRVKFPDEDKRKLMADDWRDVQAKGKAAKAHQTDRAKLAAKNNGRGVSANTVSGKSESAKDRISGMFKGFTGSAGKKVKGATGEREEADADATGASSSSSSAAAFMNVPQSFEELATMNAGIIGADMAWIPIVMKTFEQLVGAVTSGQESSLEGACDVLALQISREAKGAIKLKEFQTCMLSALRSLLPERWGSLHEGAWIELWGCVEQQLQPTLALPKKYEQPVTRFVAGLSNQDKKTIGINAFTQLFKDEPVSENYFKQSNARLSFVVCRAMELAVALFLQPAKTIDEVTSLGLRHIMFQASTKFFQPLVSAIITEIRKWCKDSMAIEGLNWALCVIASVMVQTIEDGATPLLRAVVKNDPKGVKKALSLAPRNQRTEWMIGR